MFGALAVFLAKLSNKVFANMNPKRSHRHIRFGRAKFRGRLQP
jgi:hypothetical protein